MRRNSRIRESQTSVLPLLAVAISTEQDVVTARQRARQIAEYAGFDRQDQVRVATAVSEIARNAHQYGGGGRVEFSIENVPEAALRIVVSDSGPGIPHLDKILDGTYRSPTGMGLGIVGAQRLVDAFTITSNVGAGTTVWIRKYLPADSPLRNPGSAGDLAQRFLASRPASSLDELQVQNYQLVQALDTLRQREHELQRVNQELEDTNRGVMALYAELEDRAISLRRAGELKSRFLSYVSHEFRTPLNSILALARLLLARVDGPLLPEQEKQIGYIRKAAEDLTQIVNDLLDLAKVEAGQTVVNVSHFSVVNLFGALRGMMRPVQAHQGVELIIEEPDPALVLNTDEAKVSQVLRNLVSNALKFTDRGEVRVHIEREPETLTFVVSDTGIGIPLEQQERIFQEFTQVENPLQRTVKGTGLGLPLSRKFAELLGGSLTVSSQLGQGSIFRFTLPEQVIVHAAGGEADYEYAGAVRSESNALLVIDDDEVSRYLVRQFLRGSDLTVEEAESGSTGLDRARFERPRGILLDLSMPDMSGFEVLEHLREAPETASIPVIIYTSRTLTVTDRERLARFASGIISKRDLTQHQFLAELRRTLGDIAVAAETEH